MKREKHGYIGLIIGIFFAFVFAGCGNGNNDAEKADYRQEFTDSEMEEGHAEFEVAEHLCVDADLTLKSIYEDGLNSYYMVNYYEEGELEAFVEKEKGVTVFGQSRDTFLGCLSEFWDIDLDIDSIEVFADGGIMSWILSSQGNTNGYSYIFSMNWEYGDSFSYDYVYYPYLYLMLKDDTCLTYSYNEAVISSSLQEEDLSFGGKDEIALELVGMLEELTGKEFSDTWDCVAVSSEIIEEAGVDDNDFSNEYYSYSFYYEIDGVPVDNIGMTYELKDGETCTLEARYTSEATGSVLNSQSENAQQIIIGENGLLYLFISHLRDAGDVYREAQEIISPSEVLSKLADYYDTQVMTDTVTITEMRLVYSGYFTDGEDGEIDNAYLPFWKVTVYDESLDCYMEFVYDAVTGESMY